MKQIKGARGRLGFQIERSEKRLLLEVLKLYPMVPEGHQKLSKMGQADEDQQLLEEALAEQRLENRKQLEDMLNARNRFRKIKGRESYQLSLKTSEVDWLLQVLNDIRVGSWVKLGSPEKTDDFFSALNEQTAPYFWAMEVSGQFQMILVHALSKSS